MKYYILFGPPGAGKGTQASAMVEKYNLCHLSTGELLRKEIAEGTELGKKAKSLIDAGSLVPDEVVEGMIDNAFKTVKGVNGFLLDGYPRNVEQAHVLADMCAEIGIKLDLVLEIQVDEDEVVTRMMKRAQEQHRTDDTEPVMRHRLEVYHQQTEPVAAYYADHDLLQVVDGSGSIDEVTERIFAVLDSVAKN